VGFTDVGFLVLRYEQGRSITGLVDLRQGLGVEISPFVVGRMKDAFSTFPRAWQGSEGLDFTWKITPQLVTVFTANPDFAETEVDSRQINITRFPLFFPESGVSFWKAPTSTFSDWGWGSHSFHSSAGR
jgi:hypothetical protein